MTTNWWSKELSAVILLGLSHLSFIQDSPSDRRASPPPDEARGTIQVHGHWKVDVRERDGRVVAHHEFENGLVGDGKIIAFLAGTAFLGSWYVVLGSNICDTAGGTSPSDCAVTTPRNAINQKPENFFDNLTVTSTAGQIVFAGSAKAAHDGQISTVKTVVAACGGTGATPSNCMQNFSLNLKVVGDDVTFRDLTAPSGNPPVVPPPILVKKGQTIDVSVTISFS